PVLNRQERTSQWPRSPRYPSPIRSLRNRRPKPRRSRPCRRRPIRRRRKSCPTPPMWTNREKARTNCRTTAPEALSNCVQPGCPVRPVLPARCLALPSAKTEQACAMLASTSLCPTQGPSTHHQTAESRGNPEIESTRLAQRLLQQFVDHLRIGLAL